MGSISFIAFVAPAEIALIVILVKWVEEPEAVRKFGEDYLAYRDRMPMFSLRPSCLRALFGKER